MRQIAIVFCENTRADNGVGPAIQMRATSFKGSRSPMGSDAQNGVATQLLGGSSKVSRVRREGLFEQQTDVAASQRLGQNGGFRLQTAA